MDATANPHIALTAIVAAGMLGSLVKCTLPPPLQVHEGSLMCCSCFSSFWFHLCFLHVGCLPKSLWCIEAAPYEQQSTSAH